MVEQFARAALRHLATAESLEDEGKLDDAGYHYGLVGEMALKSAAQLIYGPTLPQKLKFHINHGKVTLQDKIAKDLTFMNALRSGRFTGGLDSHLAAGTLQGCFAGWSINIRYADDGNCPVQAADVTAWRADAIALYNNGMP